MRKLFAYMMLAAMSAFASCQSEEQVSYASLSISPVVIEARTKAVTADDMNVYIDGEDFHLEYPYSALPSIIPVPVDKDIPYVIMAENITAEEAETQPDEWGQMRYAGVEEVLVDRFMTKDENGENIPLTYPVTVKCTVANSMLSVIFDQSVLTYYTGPKVTAFTDKSRQLEFTPDNATSALAHFTADRQLFFEFTGIFNVSGEERSHLDAVEIEPAMHYTLTFKMTSVEGSLARPDITVIETCEDIYETMTVDPSDDGVFEKQ